MAFVIDVMTKKKIKVNEVGPFPFNGEGFLHFNSWFSQVRAVFVFSFRNTYKTCPVGHRLIQRVEWEGKG